MECVLTLGHLGKNTFFITNAKYAVLLKANIITLPINNCRHANPYTLGGPSTVSLYYALQ